MAITVGELVERAELGATAVAGQRGLHRQVTVPRIQKPGLALTGWPEQLHEGCELALETRQAPQLGLRAGAQVPQVG